MLDGNNNYPRTVTSAYDTLTHFELEAPKNHRIKRTGDIGNRGNFGRHGGMDHIDFSNTPHHQVQYSFQVYMDARHIPLGAPIVRSGYIMRIRSQNPRDTIGQITQEQSGTNWEVSRTSHHWRFIKIQLDPIIFLFDK